MDNFILLDMIRISLDAAEGERINLAGKMLDEEQRYNDGYIFGLGKAREVLNRIRMALQDEERKRIDEEMAHHKMMLERITAEGGADNGV